MCKSYKCNKLALLCFTSLAILIGLFLASAKVSADSSEVIDHVLIAVPTACTLSGSGMNSHTATINSGQYNSAVGETTMKAVCNDQNGFAIYAVGYTDDTDGKNVLTNSALGSSSDIATGTGITGSSQWAMKLSTITSPTPSYPITILNNFDNFHSVPDDYTLVAKRESATDSGDNPEGSTFKTTYQVYVSTSQATGSYTGQVKYTLVHPHSNPIPNDTMLDTGANVCAKMKTLAAGTDTTCGTKTSDIKAIRMADSLPSGFVASDANTVSTSTSKHPIYIFYDNTDNAGIMYFYSGGYQIVMNPTSSQMFRGNLALSDISGLATWDSSNVTTMRSIFSDSTIALTNVDALANWDTSRVTDFYFAFATNSSTINAGYSPQLSDVSALANWNTSSVETMRAMFQYAPLQNYSALAFWDTSSVNTMQNMFFGTTLTSTDVFSSWDTSNVINMSTMFSVSTITNVDGLADWDVSKVEDMSFMFSATANKYSAEGDGVRSQLVDISGLAAWEVGNVQNMKSMFYDVDLIKDVDALASWDTGSVTDMSYMFYMTDSLENLNGLRNWDVSKVTTMLRMFQYTAHLKDSSAIEGWDVRAVNAGSGGDATDNGFQRMFLYSSKTPGPFTLRPGTWISGGTYSPSS